MIIKGIYYFYDMLVSRKVFFCLTDILPPCFIQWQFSFYFFQPFCLFDMSGNHINTFGFGHRDQFFCLLDSIFFACCVQRNFFPYTIDLITKIVSSAGCEIWHKGNNYYASAPQTTIISTVGAGDALSAGFLASFLKDQNISQAIQSANSKAAEVLALEGAF